MGNSAGAGDSLRPALASLCATSACRQHEETFVPKLTVIGGLQENF